MPPPVIIYAKNSCGTCKQAIEWLEQRGVKLEIRDIINTPPTKEFLLQHIDPEDVGEYLNPRSPIYRERFMNDKPPSREEAIRFMRIDPNLIKRPVLIQGDQVVFGFDNVVYDELFGD